MDSSGGGGRTALPANAGAMFLKVDGRLIKLESMEQYSALEISDVRPWLVVRGRPRHSFLCLVGGRADPAEFDGGQPDRVRVETYGRRKSGAIDQFDALGAGQYLFFDPSFLFGIKVGGERQREYWLRKHHQRRLAVAGVPRRPPALSGEVEARANISEPTEDDYRRPGRCGTAVTCRESGQE
jgi:hypothetical protein